MEYKDKAKQGLINTIINDAKEEAKKNINDANKYVEDKNQYLEKSIFSLKTEIDQKFSKEIDSLINKYNSMLNIERKKAILISRQSIVSDIFKEIEDRLALLIKDKKYKSILENLIIEAGIGLNINKAKVNASSQEINLIDDKMLSNVEKKIKVLVGINMKITKSKEACLKKQGIILTSNDEKTAFNNQIHTRILRMQSEIQKIIYNNLFIE